MKPIPDTLFRVTTPIRQLRPETIRLCALVRKRADGVPLTARETDELAALERFSAWCAEQYEADQKREAELEKLNEEKQT